MAPKLSRKQQHKKNERKAARLVDPEVQRRHMERLRGAYPVKAPPPQPPAEACNRGCLQQGLHGVSRAEISQVVPKGAQCSVWLAHAPPPPGVPKAAGPAGYVSEGAQWLQSLAQPAPPSTAPVLEPAWSTSPPAAPRVAGPTVDVMVPPRRHQLLATGGSLAGLGMQVSAGPPQSTPSARKSSPAAAPAVLFG